VSPPRAPDWRSCRRVGGGQGAALGAGGGATTPPLTKDKEVKVPAKSLLQFRLTNTLHFEAAG
jgi:hypothetical protein